MISLITIMLALAMGFVVGLLGAGGAILTIPILVYSAGFLPTVASSYSFVIVGITSGIGVLARRGEANLQLAQGTFILVPSSLTLLMTRSFLLPLLPFRIHLLGYELTRDSILMLYFALVLVTAGLLMVRQRPISESNAVAQLDFSTVSRLIGIGILVGIISGPIGIGGGFIILPALVLILRLSMKEAARTSLFLITCNSIVGFLGDFVDHGSQHFDLSFLSIFVSGSVLGMVAGTFIAKRTHPEKLKVWFGYFLIVLSVTVMYREWSTGHFSQ